MCVNLCIGDMATPFLGVNLFVGTALPQTKVETLINKYLVMYIISDLMILLLITYVPDIVMLFPNWTKKYNNY
jgi:C4-dicarboxylate transporter, DctM subunit